jgi:glycosyltransferase involved in cell wall biosynthesis
MIELSVVIPVFQGAECLEELHRRLQPVLKKTTPYYEIIFVEDGGQDNSWEILKSICKKDSKTSAYRLSRNFGQHAAITAGLSKSSGKWTMVMDCDLQDQPEEIPHLYNKAREGFDIVLTKRTRKKHSFLRNFTGRIYFRLLNFFNGNKIDPSVGSFSLISRKVVESYLRMNDLDRHYLFILRWLGFQTAVLEYAHAERFKGKSSYSFSSLLSHAFNGLFFQTTILLRWIVYLGLGLSATGFLLTLYFLFLYFYHSIQPGWTSLAILLLLLGGFIIASTGITGLYIGKIFEQVKQRPLYVFDQQIEPGRMAPADKNKKKKD